MQGTWLGLSRDLSILSLRENYISSLDERAFATAGGIRELDLGRNRLEQIHPEAFAGLPNLRVLYLDSNKLSYNTPPSFPAFLTPLRPLAELNLASNDLPWLAFGLFIFLSELSQLDLSGCGIRNISPQAFLELKQLRGLKLHDNFLPKLLVITLKCLTNFRKIQKKVSTKNSLLSFFSLFAYWKSNKCIFHVPLAKPQ